MDQSILCSTFCIPSQTDGRMLVGVSSQSAAICPNHRAVAVAMTHLLMADCAVAQPEQTSNETANMDRRKHTLVYPNEDRISRDL